MEDALLDRAIETLKRDLKEINCAIWALESLAAGRPRRGRPPKFVTEMPLRSRSLLRAGAPPGKVID